METKQTPTLAEYIRELASLAPIEQAFAAGHRGDGALWLPEAPGLVYEINGETYDWFVEVLPPHYLDRGVYCFAEGWTPFVLFFARAGRFFARLLTWDETRTFCRLAGIPLPGF